MNLALRHVAVAAITLVGLMGCAAHTHGDSGPDDVTDAQRMEYERRVQYTHERALEAESGAAPVSNGQPAGAGVKMFGLSNCISDNTIKCCWKTAWWSFTDTVGGAECVGL